MPSSTSSSNPGRAIPGGPWFGPGVLAILLALGLAAVAEWSLRRAGHRPSFDDDPIWWAYTRREVNDDPNVVALLGTSRMLLAVSRETWEREAPGRRVVQLAINGTPALGALEHLAADPAFRGTAIVDLAEWDVTAKSWDSSQKWVHAYDRFWRAPGEFANAYLRGLVKSQTTVVSLDGRLILASLMRDRSWPEQRWVVTQPDRFRAGDYTRANKKSLEAQRKKNRGWVPKTPLAPAEWLIQMERVEAAVTKIQARGGRVVIVRMPTSGEQLARAEQAFPRAQYWDVFAARTKAVTIHFQDLPGLADLVCPDEAHLDQRDQPRFTRALVDALRAKGVLGTTVSRAP